MLDVVLPLIESLDDGKAGARAAMAEASARPEGAGADRLGPSWEREQGP